MSAELLRPIAADRIGASALDVTVEADAAECAALAHRMLLPAVTALRCTFRLTRLAGPVILAKGRLHAEIVQTCVVTLEDFAATIDEAFRVRFVPAGTESDNPDPEADDDVGYVDGVLDLGEAAAEQLALSLDPYPRAPGAELPEIETEAPEHPLAALRRRH
jgi:hypothetical protein